MRKILAATAMAIVSTSATANYLPVPVVPKPIIVPHSGGGGGGANDCWQCEASAAMREAQEAGGDPQ